MSLVAGAVGAVAGGISVLGRDGVGWKVWGLAWIAMSVAAGVALVAYVRRPVQERGDDGLLAWAGTTNSRVWWLVPFGLLVLALGAFAAAFRL